MSSTDSASVFSIFRAKKIQQSEMVNKSIKELKEIAKSNSNTATKMAANLELKQRS